MRTLAIHHRKKITAAGLLMGLVLCAISLAAPASAAPQSVGGRPANPDPANPRSNSIFIAKIDRGQSKDEVITLTNNTDEIQTISLFPTDGILTNTGSFSCKQNAEERESAGSWIQLSQTKVVLQPRTETNVTFTINVPHNASIGEHNSCITMQVDNDPGRREGHVNLHFRSAIRVAVTVPGEVFKKLSFNTFTIRTTRSSQLYEVVVANEGNVSVDTELAVRLKNIFGHAHYHNGGTYPVLPDSKLGLQFENNQLPFWGGWYWAEAVASYNADPYMFGVNPENASYTSVSTGKRLIFIWPQIRAMICIIVISLLVLGTLFYLWLQSNRRKSINEKWRVYTVKTNDTLYSIAKTHGISWRTLAWMNRLKAPYTLSKGQTIYVPKSRR